MTSKYAAKVSTSIMLDREQKKYAETLAEEVGLRGYGEAVRLLLDEAIAARQAKAEARA